MLDTILLVAGGVVGGLVVALKVIAPRTKTMKDDEVLALLEKVLPYLPHDTEARKAAVAAAAKVVK